MSRRPAQGVVIAALRGRANDKLLEDLNTDAWEQPITVHGIPLQPYTTFEFDGTIEELLKVIRLENNGGLVDDQFIIQTRDDQKKVYRLQCPCGGAPRTRNTKRGKTGIPDDSDNPTIPTERLQPVPEELKKKKKNKQPNRRSKRCYCPHMWNLKKDKGQWTCLKACFLHRNHPKSNSVVYISLTTEQREHLSSQTLVHSWSHAAVREAARKLVKGAVNDRVIDDIIRQSKVLKYRTQLESVLDSFGDSSAELYAMLTIDRSASQSVQLLTRLRQLRVTKEDFRYCVELGSPLLSFHHLASGNFQTSLIILIP